MKSKIKIPIKSIKEELKACRKAFTSNPKAKFAWTCHHAVLVEFLTEPWQNRIKYIMTEKAESERAVRLRNFRPVRIELPAKLIKAGAEYDKAKAEWNKAWAEYDKAGAELGKAWAEYDKAGAEYGKAGAEYDKARAELEKAEADYFNSKATKATRDHDSDWPDNTWNGKDIF